MYNALDTGKHTYVMIDIMQIIEFCIFTVLYYFFGLICLIFSPILTNFTELVTWYIPSTVNWATQVELNCLFLNIFRIIPKRWSDRVGAQC